MSPPKWLFFPTPVSSGGPNLTITATTVADPSSGVARSNLNNQTFGGTQASDFVAYTSNPLRKSSTNAYIEWLFKVNTSGTYATKGDFSGAVTLDQNNCTLTMNGTTLTTTSVTIAGADSGTVVRIRFNGTSSNVSSVWTGTGSGDTVSLSLTWT